MDNKILQTKNGLKSELAIKQQEARNKFEALYRDSNKLNDKLKNLDFNSESDFNIAVFELQMNITVIKSILQTMKQIEFTNEKIKLLESLQEGDKNEK